MSVIVLNYAKNIIEILILNEETCMDTSSARYEGLAKDAVCLGMKGFTPGKLAELLRISNDPSCCVGTSTCIKVCFWAAVMGTFIMLKRCLKQVEHKPEAEAEHVTRTETQQEQTWWWLEEGLDTGGLNALQNRVEEFLEASVSFLPNINSETSFWALMRLFEICCNFQGQLRNLRLHRQGFGIPESAPHLKERLKTIQEHSRCCLKEKLQQKYVIQESDHVDYWDHLQHRAEAQDLLEQGPNAPTV